MNFRCRGYTRICLSAGMSLSLMVTGVITYKIFHRRGQMIYTIPDPPKKPMSTHRYLSQVKDDTLAGQINHVVAPPKRASLILIASAMLMNLQPTNTQNPQDPP